MPNIEARMACCLVGSPEALPRTAESLVQFLANPMQAHLFMASTVRTQSDRDALRSGLALLNSTGLVKAVAAGSYEELFAGLPFHDVAKAESWNRSFHHHNAKGSRSYRYTSLGLAVQLFSRFACFRLMQSYQGISHDSPGSTTYGVFARVRIDTLFFEPLPLMWAHAVLERRSTAVIPTGEDYGAPRNSTTDPGWALMDKLLVGDAVAFHADATVWRTMLDGTLLPDGWINEILHGLHLVKVSCLNVVRHPLAYCIADGQGRCRFCGELLQTFIQLGKANATSLLRTQPQLCDLQRPLEGCTPSRRVQAPEAMLRRDPGLCGLVSFCRSAQSNHSARTGSIPLFRMAI